MTKLACLILALTQGVSPAWAVVESASQALIDQATYWHQKNRDDLAGDAWRKLLRAEPNHPKALIELANIELRAGHRAEAEALYNRAAKLNPPPAGYTALGNSLNMSTVPQTELDAARKQAQAGKPEAAVQEYRKALNGDKPSGALGLEYYQTLGGTRTGWSEARLGLEKLVQEHPGEHIYLLALAKHLSYRETTRREGIRQLIALSADEVDAVTAWRQALVWLNARPADRKLFLAYLDRNPEDQGVRARLAALDKPVRSYRPNAESLARQSGYKQLDRGDLEQAEAKFEETLNKRPHDADALGGMGLVRLRQEAFPAAIDYFEQAKRYDRRGARRWDKPRNSAVYWLQIQQASEAHAAGENDKAESYLRQATRTDTQEATGQVMLADLMVEQQRYDQAEAIYRKVLRQSPENADAFAGLLGILTQSGRDAEVERMLSSYENSAAMQASGNDHLKAAVLVRLAAQDEKQGDYKRASMRLEDALLLDPTNPWIRLSLAKQYQKLGYTSEANALLDNLADAYPELPAAIHARALLYAEQNAWADGLLTLERIPPVSRNAALKREQRRFWVHAQVQRAQQLHKTGDHQQAKRLMQDIETVAGNDHDLLSVTAGGWSTVEQPDDALRLMRKIVAGQGDNNIDNRLQYAGALLNSRQYVELGAVLRSLSRVPERLSKSQHDELNNIIIAYTVRQTDSLRESGHLAEAYRVLKPAWDNSDDARLQMALARLYNTGSDPAKALQITEDVLARSPDDLDNQLFASSMALSLHQNDNALVHAQAALALQPNHPRALAAAGRAERANGNLSKAMEYFQYAQALEREDEAFADSTGGLSLRLVDEYPQEQRTPLLPVPDSLPERRDLLPVPDLLDRQGSQTGSLRLSRNVSDYEAVPVYRAPERTPAATRASATPFDAIPQPSHIAVSTVAPAFTEVAPAKPLKASSVSDEIAEMKAGNAYTVDLGSGFRNRSGEAGMSALTEIELAAELRKPIGSDGMMSLRLTPVLLNAGAMNAANPTTAVRFGSTGLGPFLATPTNVPTQNAGGVAINAAYRTGGLTMDLGTTPLGFYVTDIVGGVNFSGKTDIGMGWRGGINRRAVTDSLLSYAGAVDPRTGKVWGGVVKTGLGLAISYDQDDTGLYANAGYSALTGTDVKINNELELSTGAYKKLLRTSDTELTLGVNFSVMSYRNNLSYFTLGHGGYFSPQSYVSLALPFDISGRENKLSYQVGGDIGLRSFRTDPVVYYPNDPAQQAAWQTQIAALPGYASQYAATSVTGLGYGLFGAVEMEVGSQSAVGFRLALDNSSNYAQQSLMFYLRYSFDRLPKPVLFPPRSMRSIAQGAIL